jgi:hypothetical protein
MDPLKYPVFVGNTTVVAEWVGRCPFPGPGSAFLPTTADSAQFTECDVAIVSAARAGVRPATISVLSVALRDGAVPPAYRSTQGTKSRIGLVVTGASHGEVAGLA